MKYLYIILILSLTSCKIRNCKEVYTEVLEVGGCDRFGSCGVMTIYGKANIYNPVKGEIIEFIKCEED